MINIEIKTAISSVVIIACIIIYGYVLIQDTRNETVLDNYIERCYDTKQVITHEIEYPCVIEYCHFVALNSTWNFECDSYNISEHECKNGWGTLDKDNPRIKTINTTVCTEWILIRDDTTRIRDDVIRNSY